jgi:hypothetical protein
MAPTPRGQEQQRQRLRQADRRLQELLRRNQQRRAKERRPRPKVVVSLSEPEAALGLDKQKVFRPLYNVQWLVDLESPLVFSYGVFAQPNDAGTLPTMLRRSAAALGHALSDFLMDGSYASGRDAAAAEAAGVRLYAPWSDGPPPGPTGAKDTKAVSGRQAQQPPLLAKEQFRWEEAAHQDACPQRHPLVLVSHKTEKEGTGESHRVDIYRCAPEHCRGCPQQAGCTKSPDQGRTVRRSEFEESVERLKARMQTPAGQALYRQRKQTVELGFADLKEHRGLRRLTSRGRVRAATQIGLIVLGHNLLVVQGHVDQPVVANRQRRTSSETRT